MRYLLSALTLVTLNSFSQGNEYKGFPSAVWPKLYDIRYEKAQDEHGEYDKPVFSKDARLLEGKIVALPGYMVPFQSGNKGTDFMLTSLPLNACFFCGVGGPETVVEVRLKNPVSYTDKPVEVQGILRLNDKDPDRMIYVLELAEFLGTIEY